MRKMGLLFAAALLALAAMASAASATVANPGHITGNATAVSGSQNGTQVFTLQGGSLRVSCTTATATGPAVSGTNSSATATPTFSSCTTNIGGTRAATVTVTGAWTLTAGSFDDATGIGAPSITTGTSVSIRPTGLTCTVDVASQTISSGVATQNVTSGHVATGTSGAAGVDLAATNAAVNYTSGCPGVTSPGRGTYTGSIWLRNAWGIL